MTSSRSSSGDESGSCASAAPAAIQTPIQSARAARRMSRSSSLSWISACPPFLARPAAPRALAVVEDLAIGVGLELVLVGFPRPLARDPLGEHRDDVHALRGERPVERRGDDSLGERARRGPAGLRVLEALLEVAERQGHLDRAGVMV